MDVSAPPRRWSVHVGQEPQRLSGSGHHGGPVLPAQDLARWPGRGGQPRGWSYRRDGPGLVILTQLTSSHKNQNTGNGPFGRKQSESGEQISASGVPSVRRYAWSIPSGLTRRILTWLWSISKAWKHTSLGFDKIYWERAPNTTLASYTAVIL